MEVCTLYALAACRISWWLVPYGHCGLLIADSAGPCAAKFSVLRPKNKSINSQNIEFLAQSHLEKIIRVSKDTAMASSLIFFITFATFAAFISSILATEHEVGDRNG